MEDIEESYITPEEKDGFRKIQPIDLVSMDNLIKRLKKEFGGENIPSAATLHSWAKNTRPPILHNYTPKINRRPKSIQVALYSYREVANLVQKYYKKHFGRPKSRDEEKE